MGDRSNDRSAGAPTQVEDGGRVVAQQLVGSRYGAEQERALKPRVAAPPPCCPAATDPFPWCTQEVDDGDR